MTAVAAWGSTVRGARGAALVDVVGAVALLAVLAGAAAPVIDSAHEGQQATLAARFVAGKLHDARVEAVRRNASVAVRFGPPGARDELALYVDGNASGVLERDIGRGVDPSIGTPDRVGDHYRGASFRINQDVPEIDGAGWLAAGADPVRIGRSRLLTFSPLGSATSGTLYVARGRGPQLAVRILGATGRVRVLRYDAGAGVWRPQ